MRTKLLKKTPKTKILVTKTEITKLLHLLEIQYDYVFTYGEIIRNIRENLFH